jgi:hypothetical protein
VQRGRVRAYSSISKGLNKAQLDIMNVSESTEILPATKLNINN